MNSHHFDLGAVLCGLLMILLAAVLLTILPSEAELSEGFRTPIIAFEFARSESDLQFLAGAGEARRDARDRMDQAHRWDMVFPFAYGGFLCCLLLSLASRGILIAWLGVPFAVLVVPFDVLENLTLVGITDALRNSSGLGELLQDLYQRTWLKWGSLGLAIGCLGAGWAKNGELLSAGIGLTVAVSVGVCWLSGSEPWLTELMSTAVSVFFVWSLVRSLLVVRRMRQKSTEQSGLDRQPV